MPIKLTRTAEGLSIQIGPGGLAGIAQGMVLLGIVSIICGVGIGPAWRGLGAAFHSGKSPFGYLIGFFCLSVLAAFVAWMAFLVLFSHESVLVGPTDLEIRRCTLGWTRSRRSFPNSAVEKLRYEVRTGTRSVNRGIFFDCAGETVEFAGGTNEGQAYRIIDAMKAIYNFSTVEPEKYVAPGVTAW